MLACFTKSIDLCRRKPADTGKKQPQVLFVCRVSDLPKETLYNSFK